MTKNILIAVLIAATLGGCGDTQEKSGQSNAGRHANETGAPRHVEPDASRIPPVVTDEVIANSQGYSEKAEETSRQMQSQTEVAASYFEN